MAKSGEGLSLTIEYPMLDLDYAVQLEKSISVLVQYCARAFLRHLVTRFPVRTGFLRGALTPLENIIGTVNIGSGGKIRSRLGSKPTARERILRREFYYPSKGSKEKILKTTRSGVPFATPESEIFAPVVISPSKNKTYFKFSIDIHYLRTNDNTTVKNVPNTPWNAFAQAVDIFYKTFEANFAKMTPQVQKYILKGRITLTSHTKPDTKQKTLNNR